MKPTMTAMKNASILLDLIKADFKNRYLGHYLGVIWAFIQPLIMVAIYWFVFTKGFGAKKVAGASYLLWLFTGMVPWFLLSDAITSGSHSITSQAYLVKKMVFDVRLLPLIKIGSSLAVNAGFWGFLFLLCLYNHYYPTLLWLQLPYYLFCTIAISIVLSVFLSAVMPFLADLGQVIAVLLQILFWITPVTWNYHSLPAEWLFIVKLNPFTYIANGVRETLIDHIAFWQHPYMTFYFWSFTLLMYSVSYRTFARLRPHFADVL